MGKRFYHAPSVEAISRERINDIAPLLMSGVGVGGGPAAPSSLYVYVVNSPQFGFERLGHSGILIQQPSGAVGLYSFHPFNNSDPDAEGSIAQIVSGGDRSSFGAFRRACVAANSDSSVPGVLVDNGFLRWREPFRRALRLTVPYGRARSMESFARRAASDPPHYNMIGYNCQSFVNDVLAAGNVVLGTRLEDGSVVSYEGGIVPNGVFESANLGGTSGVWGLERIYFEEG